MLFCLFLMVAALLGPLAYFMLTAHKQVPTERAASEEQHPTVVEQQPVVVEEEAAPVRPVNVPVVPIQAPPKNLAVVRLRIRNRLDWSAVLCCVPCAAVCFCDFCFGVLGQS
jgi:hypothetical protein